LTFRTEYKYKISYNKKNEFYNWLNKIQATKLFQRRDIYSIYFDNKNLSMYRDSEEGVTPRKKIRIRYYNSKFEFCRKFLIEKKINSAEGRYKTSKSINKAKVNQFLKFGIVDNNYGLCKFKSFVVYSREYYLYKNCRITFDTDIKFASNYNSNGKFKTTDFICICEFKYNSLEEGKLHEDNFSFQQTRYSKYSESIKNMHLYN
tara:strand:+ start:384 stop:995 length:612 start_codon:yes stop_codon:yes gene_type:complete